MVHTYSVQGKADHSQELVILVVGFVHTNLQLIVDVSHNTESLSTTTTTIRVNKTAV